MSGNEPSCCLAGRRGSILILALWTIFLLALLAVAVGAHVEARLTLARRMESRVYGYHAARTGIARSLVMLEQDTNGWDATGDAWFNNPALFSNRVTEAGVYSLFYEVDCADGSRGTHFGLADEQSRIDLNLARGEVLAAVLQTAGGMGAEQARQVAAAIIAARSKPPAHDPGGTAKRGWISPRLEQGPLLSVEELRWITGMTEEGFRGIERQVTVHGGYRVNLNTAGAGVLKALATASGRGTARGAESLTRKILQFRERGGIFKGLGLGEALGAEARLTEDEKSLLTGMAPFVTVASRRFRGHVEGASSDRRGATRKIDFVWDRNHHRMEFWYED